MSVVAQIAIQARALADFAAGSGNQLGAARWLTLAEHAERALDGTRVGNSQVPENEAKYFGDVFHRGAVRRIA